MIFSLQRRASLCVPEVPEPRPWQKHLPRPRWVVQLGAARARSRSLLVRCDGPRELFCLFAEQRWKVPSLCDGFSCHFAPALSQLSNQLSNVSCFVYSFFNTNLDLVYFVSFDQMTYPIEVTIPSVQERDLMLFKWNRKQQNAGGFQLTILLFAVKSIHFAILFQRIALFS